MLTMILIIIVMIVMKMYLVRLLQNIHPPQDTISFSRLNMNDTFCILTSTNRVNDINDSIFFKNKEARLSLTKSLKLSFRIFKAVSPIRYNVIIWLNLDRSRWGLPVDEMEMKF